MSFTGSATYWDRRYRNGGNSGKGSYGRLADAKARFLNAFVAENTINTVIEFGCGDGNQLSLARYPFYVGYDLSPAVIELCRETFRGDPSKRFALISDYQGETAEMSISLDVIFHLTEDEVFDSYMHRLFDAADRFVVIYASDFDREPTLSAPHVRHRQFTRWVESNAKDWKLAHRVENEFRHAAGGDKSPAEFFVFIPGKV